MNSLTQLCLATELNKSAGRGEYAMKAIHQLPEYSEDVMRPAIQGVLSKSPGIIEGAGHSAKDMTGARNVVAEFLRTLRAPKL